MSKSATQKYVLKEGFTHYLREPDDEDGLHGDVVKVGAGTVVDLTEAQARNFRDRFELLTAVQARAESQVAMAKAATAQANEPPPAVVHDPDEVGPDAVAVEDPGFERVNVKAHGASALIKIVAKLGTEEQVRQVADDELARGRRKRSTVLAAADARLEELGA